jgi:molybdopterin-containing oxidoreductase family membrane subunit
VLALGWRGTEREWQRLEKAISIMAVLIIPVAVSVHTIVSWDFAMTVQPMWHSTIFGPYFVAGAIFSGIAALLVAMAIIRRTLNLEKYLLPIHFDNLAKLLLTMSLLWFYFTFAEYLTTWYGNEAAEMPVFWSKISGPYAPLFWTMVVCNFLIPFPLLAIKRLRTITGITIASLTVLVGMWLERFLIIVPTLVHPFLPYNYGFYRPSVTEMSIAFGTFGVFTLIYFLFVKVSPIVSVWEVEEGRRLAQESKAPRHVSSVPVVEHV